MPVYQVSLNKGLNKVIIQLKGAPSPVGSVLLNEFIHEESDNMNHVLFHHVQDILYPHKEWDLRKIQITQDLVLEPVPQSITTTDVGIIYVKVGSTYQLSWTVLPPELRNKGVSFFTPTPNSLTISPTGLVTMLEAQVALVNIRSVLDEGVNVSVLFIGQK